jgi:hypothetical protein
MGILPDEGGHGKRFLAPVMKKGAEDFPVLDPLFQHRM